MIESLFLQKRTLTLFIMCLLSGFCFHYFFYNKSVGVSVFLFTLLLYIIYFSQNKSLLRTQRKLGWFFLCVILLLATTFLLFSNEMFRFFNIVLLPLLFLYHTFLLRKGIPGEWAKPIMIARLGSAISDMIKIFFRTFSIFGVLIKRGLDEKKYEILRRILLGLIISAPILIFVTFLLMSSDDHFSRMMIQIPNWLMSLSLGSVVFQILLISFVTLGLFSYLLSLQLQSQMEGEVDTSGTNRPFDTIIVATVLILINFVYALYVLSQFSYFFDVNPASTSHTYSYATYARKGFAELTIVSIINFSILISVLHYTSLKHTISKIMIRGLLSLLVSFSGFMLFSAFHRLSLYEEAYGFTYSRVLAHSFMILLSIMLFIAFIRIWTEKISLLKTYVVLSVTFYVLLNFINIDLFIAVQNIEWYEKTGKIDVIYMETLSDDVIPYLVKLEEETGLKSDYLAFRKDLLLNNEKDWPEWNWSTHKAALFLKEMEKK
jgi:hypothetical protein